MVKRTIRKIIFCGIFLVMISAMSGAVSMAASNSGTRAADFLLIGTGAASAAMSGAYTAIGQGAQAAYWNPAALAGFDGKEIQFGHIAWYQDISLEHGSAAFKVNDKLSMAASLTYLGYGTIKGYDNLGNATDDITAYDLAGGISFGYSVSDDFSVGLTGKYVSQKLDDITGSSFAFDLGLKMTTSKITIGAVAANLGPKMKFETVEQKLPYTARLGVSFAPMLQSTISVELEKRSASDLVIKNGYQYSFNDQYFLRTGYSYFPDQDGRSFGSGLSMGAGVQLERMELNYAFAPSDKYSSQSLHRFSVIFKLGSKPKSIK